MTELNQNTAGQNGNGKSPDGAENTEKFIPKSRLDEVIAEREEYKRKLSDFETATQANEQERLRKQGEFQQLFETEKQKSGELAGKAARAEALDKVISESNKARIERLPEAMRTLVPTALPPEQVAAYLDANWALLQGVAAPDLDAGAGGGGSGAAAVVVTETDKQQAEAAKAQGYNITPEQVAARRQKK